MPKAPLDRLEKILKGFEVILIDLADQSNTQGNSDFSQKLNDLVATAKPQINTVLEMIESQRKAAEEAAYGKTIRQTKPLDTEEKIKRIRELRTTLEALEQELDPG